MTTLRERKEKKIIKKICKEIDNYYAHGNQCAFTYWEQNRMRSYGHVSITSVNEANQAVIEAHPSFQFDPAALTGAVSLPQPPPVMDHQYTCEDAKAFITEVLPGILGDRPGYGKPNLRPSWWTHAWSSVNGVGWNKHQCTRR